MDKKLTPCLVSIGPLCRCRGTSADEAPSFPDLLSNAFNLDFHPRRCPRRRSSYGLWTSPMDKAFRVTIATAAIGNSCAFAYRSRACGKWLCDWREARRIWYRGYLRQHARAAQRFISFHLLHLTITAEWAMGHRPGSPNWFSNRAYRRSNTPPHAAAYGRQPGPTRSTTVNAGALTGAEQKAEVKFKTAQAKAKRDGVQSLTEKTLTV